MFLQLLASELTKVPDIDSDIVEAETSSKKLTSISTIEDLEEASALRFQQFRHQERTTVINLPHLEQALVRAKHYQSTDILEDDFV